MYIETALVPLERFTSRLDSMDQLQVHRTVERYPFRICASLEARVMAHPRGIGRQFIPSPEELSDSQEADPLREEACSPLPGLVHRYPDRVLFLVSDRCAAYCRFCTRKRRLGGAAPDRDSLRLRLEYIRNNPEIRDVLLSGGDPMLLQNELLFWILDELFAVPHIDLVRIGTRTLSVWPQRFDPETVNALGRYERLWINTHFNHPGEMDAAAEAACRALSGAGIPLANQSVLLAGINDDAELLTGLNRILLRNRVRPYYLHMMDLTRGTAHFRVPLQRALEIYRQMQGHISGMAVPRLMLDLPGGGGKVPLVPEYLRSSGNGVFCFENFRGELFYYRDQDEADG